MLQSLFSSSFIFFLNSKSTYRYGKYDRSGKFSVESGSNREVSTNSLRNDVKYIFLSDGMLRVSNAEIAYWYGDCAFFFFFFFFEFYSFKLLVFFDRKHLGVVLV